MMTKLQRLKLNIRFIYFEIKEFMIDVWLFMVPVFLLVGAFMISIKSWGWLLS